MPKSSYTWEEALLYMALKWELVQTLRVNFELTRKSELHRVL